MSLIGRLRSSAWMVLAIGLTLTCAAADPLADLRVHLATPTAQRPALADQAFAQVPLSRAQA